MKNTEGNSRVQPRRDFLATAAVAGVSGAIGAASVPAWAEQLSANDRGPNPDLFKRHIGSKFRMTAGDNVIDARLVEANEQQVNDDRPSYVRQRPFSLYFETSNTGDFEEREYRISHPQLGTIMAHVSPVDAPSHVATLQVIFG